MITVIIKYILIKSKVLITIDNNPGAFLTKQYNVKARKIRALVKNRQQQNKTGYFGSYTTLYKGKLVDRSISKVIRLIDSEKAAMEYASEQVGVNAQYCDMIARKAFSARLLVSTMKCITGVNIHEERNT